MKEVKGVKVMKVKVVKMKTVKVKSMNNIAQMSTPARSKLFFMVFTPFTPFM